MTDGRGAVIAHKSSAIGHTRWLRRRGTDGAVIAGFFNQQQPMRPIHRLLVAEGVGPRRPRRFFSRKAATSSITSTATRAFAAESGRLPDDFLTRLLARHPSLQVSTNSYDLESHGRGESHHPTSPPDAVLFPSTVEEIQTILRLCCRESSKTADGDVSEVDIVSVVPYGAGTSVEGHLNLHTPPDEVREVPSSMFTNSDTQDKWRKVRFRRRGGVSIDMRNFDSISDVDSDAFCRVGAGVTRNRLNADLRHTGRCEISFSSQVHLANFSSRLVHLSRPPGRCVRRNYMYVHFHCSTLTRIFHSS